MWDITFHYQSQIECKSEASACEAKETHAGPREVGCSQRGSREIEAKRIYLRFDLSRLDIESRLGKEVKRKVANLY